MHFTLRLRRSNRTVISPESLSLLTNIRPTFRAQVNYASRRGSSLELQLRANVILLLRGDGELNQETVDRAIELKGTRIPRLSNKARTVSVGRESFTFKEKTDAISFRNVVADSIRSHAAAPSYVVVGTLDRSNGNASTHVARAWDADMNDGSHSQLVVVKSIPKADAFFSKTDVARTIDERIALQRAVDSGSPFLPRTLHSFETTNALNFVTDIAPLGNLRGLLNRLPRHRMPQSTARVIFAELVLALKDVHRLGLLFRDIRPESVLLSAAGHVRLASFERVKRASWIPPSLSEDENDTDHYEDDSISGEAKQEKELRAQTFIGIRAYMSPEHLKAEKGGSLTYGKAADVWALGVTLYEMVCGRRPFASVDDSNKLFQNIDHAPIQMPYFLTPSLRSLLTTMLSRDEAARPTLEDIKCADWVRTVDWTMVRKHAINNEPLDQVLSVASAVGVTSVADSFERISQSEDEDAECARLTREFSRVNTLPHHRHKFLQSERQSPQLLGFGFKMRS